MRVSLGSQGPVTEEALEEILTALYTLDGWSVNAAMSEDGIVDIDLEKL